MFRALLVALLFLTVPARAAEDVYKRVMDSGTIRCGYFTWPPYFSRDPNTGAMSGLNYDVMEAIGKTLGLKIEWAEETTPGTAIEGLNTGRYDVICTSLWPDASRLRNALLTDPTFYSTVYAVVRKNDARFDGGVKSFNADDVTIAGLDGDVTYSLAHEKFPKAEMFGLPQTSDGSHLLQAVAAQKADVTFVDKGVLADFNRNNGDILKIVPGIAPAAVLSEALGVRNGEIQLKTLLDNALRVLNDHGTIAGFIETYKSYAFFPVQPAWTLPKP